MKFNIKIFSLAIAAITFTVSCEDDDEGIGQPVIPAQSEETASLSFENEAFFGRGDVATYNATLNSASEGPKQITVVSQEGPEVTISFAIVTAGATNAQGTITIPETGPSFSYDQSGTFGAEIIGARRGEFVINEDDEEVFVPSGGDTVATSSEEATLAFYDRTPALNTGGLNILYDWVNPSENDFDLEIIDQAFTTIFDSSGTGSRYEDVLTVNADPDTDYVLYVTIFTEAPAADVNNRFFFVAPNGEKTLLEFVIPAGTAPGSRFPVATYNKATVDGEAVYSGFAVL